MDDLNHSLDFLGGDGSRSGLLAEEVHHMGGEFIARMVILVQLQIFIESVDRYLKSTFQKLN